MKINKLSKTRRNLLATCLLIAGWLLCGIGYSIKLDGLNTACLLVGIGSLISGVVLFLQSTRNPDLREYIIQIIEKSYDSKRKIVDVKILTAVGYSEALLEQIEKAVYNNSLNTFINSIKIESTTSDNLIICDVIFKDDIKHIALIYDPYELYDPTRLLKLIPVKD